MLRVKLIMGSAVLGRELPVLGPMRAPELTMESAVLARSHRMAMRLAMDDIEVPMRSPMLRIEFIMGEGVLSVEFLVKRAVFVLCRNRTVFIVCRGHGTDPQHTNKRQDSKKGRYP